MREDYSENGDAWNYFTHDQARSRAYRWGEDGLAGISDDHQVLCFALALWNGRDPILKERAVRAGQQRGQPRRGRQGVLLLPRLHADALVHEVPVQVPAGGLSRTTTWSTTNRSRGKHEPEYELLDTGVFDDDRYFDVFVEYAKAGARRPADQDQRRATAARRRRRCMCCRRSGSATPGRGRAAARSRSCSEVDARGRAAVIARITPTRSFQESLADYFLYCDGDVPLLFTENETNNERLFGAPNASPYVKDGINNFVVHGDAAAVNPAHAGTKAAAHYRARRSAPARRRSSACG